MWILVALLFVIPALFGCAAAASMRLAHEKVTLILLGSVAGIALYATAVYLTSLVIPLSQLWLGITLTLLATAIMVLVRRSRAVAYWRSLSLDKIALVNFILVFVLAALITPKLLFTSSEGLTTGIINAYGDVAWHVANIAAFADGQPFPPQDPIMAGTKLTYPFMANWFSAMLLVGGANYAQSVDLPALIFIPMLLTFFYCLVREITGNKTAAVIALLMFLFGGATLGWTRFGADWQASGQSLGQFLLHLPQRDYSGVGTDTDGYHFLNPVTTLLLPQRSLLFGFPLAFAILLLLLPSPKRTANHFAAAGVLAGLLPLFHAHTVLALLPAIIAVWLLAPSKQWWWFFMTAGIVGLPEVAYYTLGSSQPHSFFRWGPRWMAGDTNIIWYWFKNTGLLIPTAVIGLFLKAPRMVKAVTISGLLIFIVANVFLFAPWVWDNFKLIVYAYLFIVPLFAWLIATLFRARWLAIIGVIFIALHTVSAALDIWKIALPTATTWVEWDTSAVAAGEKIQQATRPGQVILTAPIHNSAVVLAGRPRYLGYAAHVWSHGGDPWTREDAIGSFYQGTLETLPEIQSDFALIGPDEKGHYPSIAVRPDWQLVANAGEYQLYKLPKF